MIATTALTLAAAIATPAPIGSTTPLPCERPAMATNVVTPEYPDAARKLGLGPASVLVRVALNDRGAVTAASVMQSSGNMEIDRAALRAAARSSYSPATHRCKPVPGTYLFHAGFWGGPLGLLAPTRRRLLLP